VAAETGQGFDPRYLAAKKGIDDRARNHHVWETLRQALLAAAADGPLHILEIGAGLGTMLQRLVQHGLLQGPVTYVATDSDPGQLRAARPYLSHWAAKEGHALSWSGPHRGLLSTQKAEISLVLGPVRAEELADQATMPGPFQLLIAHAVLDLLDFPLWLPPLLGRLTAHGLAYLTCNFDGKTLWLPACEGDKEIGRIYHASMEARLRGASHTGRRLLAFLQRPGLELLAAGSSDWLIHPRKGSYCRDEAFFLHAILATVEGQLSSAKRPPACLAPWVASRRRQLEAGQLSFLASHLDFLVRRSPLP